MPNNNVASIVDGQLNIQASPYEDKKMPSSTLGKDDFMLLLIKQMQYQDPLNPQTDTDFVAQLAQFSALEQMQNLNQATMNSQAFGLVGKEVIVQSKIATGEVREIQGVVDYVTIQSGKAYLSINGSLYSVDDLKTVLDDFYAIKQYLPNVESASLSYSLWDPCDLQLNVNLGSNGYQASALAVQAVDSAGNFVTIPSQYLAFKDGKLTISKEALKDFNTGDYTLIISFDDPLYTVEAGKVTLKITGSKAGDDSNTDDDGSSDDSTTDEVEGVDE